MTDIQYWALALYASGAVFAIWGPGIATVRIVGKYREAKANYKGTYGDVENSLRKEAVHEVALRDAVWGILEFVFVGLGVLLASVASILLVFESAVLS